MKFAILSLLFLNSCGIVPTSFWYVESGTGKMGHTYLDGAHFKDYIKVVHAKYDTISICPDSLVYENSSTRIHTKVFRSETTYTEKDILEKSVPLENTCLRFTKDSNEKGYSGNYNFLVIKDARHYWTDDATYEGRFNIMHRDTLLNSVSCKIQMEKKKFRSWLWIQ